MKIVAAGTNPVQLCRGIETTVAALVKDLQAMSTDVTDADLANVATVSAGGNEVVSSSLPVVVGTWNHTHAASEVFFAGTLLRLDQFGCPISRALVY